MTAQQLEAGYGHHHPDYQQDAIAGGQHAARNTVNESRRMAAKVTKISDISKGK